MGERNFFVVIFIAIFVHIFVDILQNRSYFDNLRELATDFIVFSYNPIFALSDDNKARTLFFSLFFNFSISSKF